MSRIRGRDTGPELAVRSLLHRAGFRFRVNRRDLPGTPDIVLPRYRVVMFVHGCFWHRHRGCRLAYAPKTRKTFWARKFKDNTQRDKKNYAALEKLGWRVIVVWECEVRETAQLSRRLHTELKGALPERGKDGLR